MITAGLLLLKAWLLSGLKWVGWLIRNTPWQVWAGLALAAGVWWYGHRMYASGVADERAQAAEMYNEALQARMDANLQRMLTESRIAIAERAERQQHQHEITVTHQRRERDADAIILASPSAPECVLPSDWLPLHADALAAARAAAERVVR